MNVINTDKLAEVFKDLPDPARAVLGPTWNTPESCGFIIRWARKGQGFGELTFRFDKGEGSWHIDTEGITRHLLGEILAAFGRPEAESGEAAK